MNATQSAAATAQCKAVSADRILQDAFAQHQGELLGTLYYMVGNVEDARDALQETFLKCWKHQANIGEIKNLKAWIFRVALNTARDLRQTAWRRKRKSMPDEETMIASTQSSPDATAEESEQLGRLRQALRALREEEQAVFLLRQNGDMTYDEIAVAIGVPTGTVKTRMRLAVTKLRAALAET